MLSLSRKIAQIAFRQTACLHALLVLSWSGCKLHIALCAPSGYRFPVCLILRSAGYWLRFAPSKQRLCIWPPLRLGANPNSTYQCCVLFRWEMNNNDKDCQNQFFLHTNKVSGISEASGTILAHPFLHFISATRFHSVGLFFTQGQNSRYNNVSFRDKMSQKEQCRNKTFLISRIQGASGVWYITLETISWHNC